MITYRELRLLELQVLTASTQFGANIESVFKAISVNIDQFSGIELEDFPAQIAQVAMWLVGPQMNIATGELLGEWFARIPLTKSLNIRIGNALRLDWEALCPSNQLHYLIGNPPFIGKSNQTAAQKEDMDFVTKGIKSAGVLDYVAGWNIKAAQYFSDSKIGCISRDKTLFSDVEFSQPTNSVIAGSTGNQDSSVIAGSIRNLNTKAQTLNQVQGDKIKAEMLNQVQHDKIVGVIKTAAQGVLDACAQFPNESLANLYGATMPPALVKAQAALDKAFDAAHLQDGGAKRYANDAERVAFLFNRYQALTSLI